MKQFQKQNLISLSNSMAARSSDALIDFLPESIFPSYSELHTETSICSIGVREFLKYRILPQILGRGTFGRVQVGINLETGARVAIKIIDKTKLRPEDMKSFSRECAILSRLNHPHIIQIYGGYNTTKKLYWILSLMEGGDFSQYLFGIGRPLVSAEARSIFRQLVTAVAYCHSMNIIHRDIKLENLLVAEATSEVQDCRIVLSDFGLAAIQAEGDPGLKDHPGSPNYAAPELLRRDDYAGRPVDIWAMGVCLFAITQGQFPFTAPTLPQLYFLITWEDPKFQIPLGKNYTNLMGKLLHKNFRDRISILELWNSDPWVLGWD